MDIQKREIRKIRKLCSELKFVITSFLLAHAHMGPDANSCINRIFINDKGNITGKYCRKFIRIQNGFLLTKSYVY